MELRGARGGGAAGSFPEFGLLGAALSLTALLLLLNLFSITDLGRGLCRRLNPSGDVCDVLLSKHFNEVFNYFFALRKYTA